MDDLLNDFIAETRETLEAIAGEIVRWEADPSDRARLDAIFRFVHTVKGSCGFLDLPRLERLSHAAEDALSAVRSDLRVPDRALVSAILAIIDRIAALADALESGGSVGDDDATLIAALEPDAAGAEPLAAPEPQLASLPTRAAPRTIRLPVELLDRMMASVSDMVLARNELSRRLREATHDAAVDAAFERLSLSVAEMRDSITRTRMQRIENLFTALPRMVRDVSAEVGKSVALRIDGGDVELDREMVEMIRDPLTHIVRNAIDHGIEAPADRARLGKPTTGVLRVSARQSGNQILIEVADDGRGIDGARLVEKAVSAGVMDRERAARLTEQARLALIFEPGLSTAGAITAISGRGVGMDVVRSNIERIGGVVDLDSRLGHGLRLTLRVPLTLTIIPALTVSAAGHQFAVPRSAIQEIVRADAEAIRIERIGGAAIAWVRGVRMPMVDLGSLMGGPEERPRILVLVKPAATRMFALAVCAVHDHEELVVKPAAPAVMQTGLYAGTTLPDTGRPMLLLDVSGVAEAAGIAIDDQNSAAAEPTVPEAVERTVPTLLFRDLQHRLCGIRLSVVERIEDVKASAIVLSAGQLRIVQGDRLLPLVAVGEIGTRATVRVLRLSDGSSEIGYAIDSVIDVAALPDTLQPGDAAGPVLGVMLVDGAPVELLDPFWLFEDYSACTVRRPICLLRDGDDPWMREFLAPLVARAGYAVTFTGEPDEGAASIVVASVQDAGSDAGASVDPQPVVRIRAHPAPRGSEDRSIYRYDRSGLLAALDRAAASGA
jgi:two-component system chemotaxis sensor kinase CheA